MLEATGGAWASSGVIAVDDLQYMAGLDCATPQEGQGEGKVVRPPHQKCHSCGHPGRGQTLVGTQLVPPQSRAEEAIGIPFLPLQGATAPTRSQRLAWWWAS